MEKENYEGLFCTSFTVADIVGVEMKTYPQRIERKRIKMKKSKMMFGLLSLSATILLGACSTGTTDDPVVEPVNSVDPVESVESVEPMDSMESIESESVSMITSMVEGLS